MPRIRITKASVDAAIATKSDTFFWDEQLAGFGLKVTPLGTKSYVAQYRAAGQGGATRRVTIGRHGSPWTPAAARAEAERLLLNAATGGDPQVDKLARRHADPELGFMLYAERYLTNHGRRMWRPRTWAAVESNIRRYAVPVLGKKPIDTIARSDLVKVFDSLPSESPALPRNLHAHLRGLFRWAEERGDVERSPFFNMRSPPAVQSRERVLSDAEIRLIWKAANADTGRLGIIIRLLLLTGQRRDEVASMRWEELDKTSSSWLLPGERTKNGRAHRVPLTAAVTAEIDLIAHNSTWPRSGWVFTTTGSSSVSGFSRAKRRLDGIVCKLNDDVPLAPWRLHDLRRTMATGLQRLGVRFEVTEALLNHFDGARSGIAGVYQRHDWAEEKVAALGQWNERLFAVFAGESLVEVRHGANPKL